MSLMPCRSDRTGNGAVTPLDKLAPPRGAVDPVRGGEQLHSGHIWHALVGQAQRDLFPCAGRGARVF
jgi:hypothetical protein